MTTAVNDFNTTETKVQATASATKVQTRAGEAGEAGEAAQAEAIFAEAPRKADDQARKLAFLAMGEKELRSLAGKALQGPIDNEDLLDPEPGTDSQLALAELGRRWQKWYIFKCMLPELTGLGTPARSVLRMTAEDVAAASQGGVDSVGVLAMVRYADMTRGTRRIWRGTIKRPLEAHLQVSGLAHVASTTPLGVLFGLEPRDLAADEEKDEVAPEIADMVHNWPCDPHRDHRLAEAREWVGRHHQGLSFSATGTRAPQ